MSNMRFLIKFGGPMLVVAVAAAANPGYLAIVGPPALRFDLSPKLDAIKVTLPPLLVPETNQLTAAIEPAPPPPALPPPPAATNPPPLQFNIFGTTDVMTNLAPLPVREAEVVSPQIWLKYFARNTNAGTAGAIAAPIGFLPPQPITPPSSKSTYRTGP